MQRNTFLCLKRISFRCRRHLNTYFHHATLAPTGITHILSTIMKSFYPICTLFSRNFTSFNGRLVFSYIISLIFFYIFRQWIIYPNRRYLFVSLTVYHIAVVITSVVLSLTFTHSSSSARFSPILEMLASILQFLVSIDSFSLIMDFTYGMADLTRFKQISPFFLDIMKHNNYLGGVTSTVTYV